MQRNIRQSQNPQETIPSDPSATNYDNDFEPPDVPPNPEESRSVPESERLQLKRPYHKKDYGDIVINCDEGFPTSKRSKVVDDPSKKKAKNFKKQDERMIEMVLIEKDRLLCLFYYCPKCHTKLGDRKITLNFVGTAATVYYNCPGCEKRNQTWSTQTYLPHRRIYKGNAIVACAASIVPIAFPVSFISMLYFIKVKISDIANIF
jgi:hypothetical protein